MSHTPEQARELWCPMVRIARHEAIEYRTGYMESYRDEQVIVAGCNTDALGSNRVPASCRCIAEKCAMWRWEIMEVLPPNAEPNKLVALIKARANTGYCGLAGRPEVAP